MTDDEREKKAEELRDIFVDVTDEETVTEEKEEERGTLPGEEEIDDEINEIVEEMRDEYGFETSLDDDEVVRVVRLYHDGASDAEMARELGDDSLDKTVRRARVGLHLFRDSDFDAPFDIERLEELLDEDFTNSETADELGVSASTVRSYRRAVEARRRSGGGGRQVRREVRSRPRRPRYLRDVHARRQTRRSGGRDRGRRGRRRPMSPRKVTVDEAATLLRSGGVVVYPTETVYGVGADAYNETAVERVYRVKERPTERPLSVAVGSVEHIEKVARPRDDALEFAREFLPGSVTPLLPRRQRVPEIVTSGDLIGVRVPDDGMARELIHAVGPITSTSANMSGEPPATRPDELGRLADRVDGVVDDGVRDGEPSTVVDTTTWEVVREGAEVDAVRDWISRNVP